MTITRELKEYERVFFPADVFLIYDIIFNSQGLSRSELETVLGRFPNIRGPYLSPTLLFLECARLINLDSKYRGLEEIKFDDFVLWTVEFCIKKLCKSVRNLFIQDYSTNTCFSLNSDIPTSLSVFRNYLIDSGFYNIHEKDKNKLMVSPEFRALSDEYRATMTINDFNEMLMRDRDAGDAAEKYVLDYEQRRLANHPHKSKIRIISSFDVTAGFDIMSFDDVCDNVENRFIEVKGYNGSPVFYWSQNEFMCAKRLGGKYYLYVVNLKKITDENYVPDMISDPYATIFKDSSWVTEIQSIKFSKKRLSSQSSNPFKISDKM